MRFDCRPVLQCWPLFACNNRHDWADVAALGFRRPPAEEGRARRLQPICCCCPMRCLAQSACRSFLSPLRSPAATFSRAPLLQQAASQAAPRSVPRPSLRIVCNAASGSSGSNMSGAPSAADQAVASDLLAYLNASVSDAIAGACSSSDGGGALPPPPPLPPPVAGRCALLNSFFHTPRCPCQVTEFHAVEEARQRLLKASPLAAACPHGVRPARMAGAEPPVMPLAASPMPLEQVILVTPFHLNCPHLLQAGFVQLSERQGWDGVAPGGRYFFTRNASTLVRRLWPWLCK